MAAMPRKLRLEYEGACYHVLNRGNYRSHIFGADGAKQAFLTCLDEAAVKAGWVIHAWCVMSNHYHLAVETPKGNLVAGMKWLQATFAARFNRFRGESGHLFQGRYKSFIIEPGESLGPLCHYIHLNPVRAKVVSPAQLPTYAWSSVRWLAHPKARKAWYSPEESLRQAGGLPDGAAGRKRYLQYLDWLAEDAVERKRQRFDEMSKGWVLGTRAFMRALTEDHKKLGAALKHGYRELAGLQEEAQESTLAALLKRLGKSAADVAQDAKAAPWKIAIATEMKRRTTVSNPWLSGRLNMGSPFRVSRLVSACTREPGEAAPFLRTCAKCKV